MRRQCKSAAVHLGLPPIAQVREYLREALSTHIAEGTVAKTWLLVILNSATPQEAIECLKKRFTGELPCSPVNFAREVFSASRYVMNHPPPWCPPVAEGSVRGAPFHFLRSWNSGLHGLPTLFSNHELVSHQQSGCMMAFGLPLGQERKCLQRSILTSAKPLAMT